MEDNLIRISIGFIPIVAALVAGIIVLKQVRRNSITSARLKWLDDLKTQISECMKLVSSYLLFSKMYHELPDDDDDFKLKHVTDFVDKVQPTTQELTKIIMLIALNLNKAEILSQVLLIKLTELMVKLNPFENKELLKTVTPLLEEIEIIASNILKIEWEKTKSQRIHYKSRKDLLAIVSKSEDRGLALLDEQQKRLLIKRISDFSV